MEIKNKPVTFSNTQPFKISPKIGKTNQASELLKSIVKPTTQSLSERDTIPTNFQAKNSKACTLLQ